MGCVVSVEVQSDFTDITNGIKINEKKTLKCSLTTPLLDDKNVSEINFWQFINKKTVVNYHLGDYLQSLK